MVAADLSCLDPHLVAALQILGPIGETGVRVEFLFRVGHSKGASHTVVT